MHLKILVLLAVTSTFTDAGLLRRGPVARPGHLIRSFNQSSIPIVPEIQLPETKSDSSIAAISTLPVGTEPEPSPFTAALITALPSKQVGSVPAVGNGPGAASLASRDSVTLSTESSSSTVKLKSSTYGKPPLPSESSPAALLSSFRKANEPLIATTTTTARPESPVITKASTSSSRLFPLGTGVGTISPTTTHTSIAKAVSSLASVLRSKASTASASATVTPLLSSQQTAPAVPFITNATQLASVSSLVSILKSKVSTMTAVSIGIPTITDVPAPNGNVELANQFNSYFSSINANSQCSPNVDSQAYACINEQTAHCGSDHKYVITPCDEGQRCRALPLDNKSKGISIQCIRSSDADARLGSGQNSSEARTTVSITSTSTKITSIFSVTTATSASTSRAVSAASKASDFPSAAVSSATIAMTAHSASKSESSKATPNISAAPAVQSSKPSTPDKSSTVDDQPAIIITPVPRRTATSVSPTHTDDVSLTHTDDVPPAAHINAVQPVTTNKSVVSGTPDTVTETVTATVTVHDGR